MTSQHDQAHAAPSRPPAWQSFADEGPAIAAQLAELAAAVANLPDSAPAAAMVAGIEGTFEPHPDMTVDQARARRAALLRKLAAWLDRAPAGQAASLLTHRVAHACRRFARHVDRFA